MRISIERLKKCAAQPQPGFRPPSIWLEADPPDIEIVDVVPGEPIIVGPIDIRAYSGGAVLNIRPIAPGMTFFLTRTIGPACEATRGRPASCRLPEGSAVAVVADTDPQTRFWLTREEENHS